MAAEYGYGYGGYRDDDDANEDYGADYNDTTDEEAEYPDAADHEDYGTGQDTVDLTTESVSDASFLTGAVDEPVHDAADEPAVGESVSYERIRRMKGSRRWQAWDRRKGRWIPPDLRRYGSPVFWPVDEPQEPEPTRRVDIDFSAVEQETLRLVLMAPLLSGPEIAKALGLDEAVVKKAVQALRRNGLLKSISFGCLMRPTPRYWVEIANCNLASWNNPEPAVLSWHSDDAIGSLLRYDVPRVESINQVAVRYVNDTWSLEGVAWVERDAVKAIGLYHWKRYPYVKALVYFAWVSLWDTEREIWERVSDIPKAASRITPPGIVGHVALIGADRWAAARALPMAVEGLMKVEGVREWPMEPADVSAWTCADGWQAASGASMLEYAGKPFSTSLFAAPLHRFERPQSQRRLGKTKLATIIKNCLWTRRDAATLFRTRNQVGEYPLASIAHHIALAGKTDNEVIIRKRVVILVHLGQVREAGIAGVPNLGTPDRPEALSARGRGQMRYRLSLSPKREKELAKEDTEGFRGDHVGPTSNGAFGLALDSGGLSYNEIVRRTGLTQLTDRFTHRLVHEDVLLDTLGRLRVLGCEVVPASRAKTVDFQGREIRPDYMIYCVSPAGIGWHYGELELSHLNPGEIRPRLRKYRLRVRSYPLTVVCKTDRGARHYDRIGQEEGVPVVATSLPRLTEIGFSGPAWLYHGEEVCVTPVSCPPRPESP